MQKHKKQLSPLSGTVLKMSSPQLRFDACFLPLLYVALNKSVCQMTTSNCKCKQTLNLLNSMLQSHRAASMIALSFLSCYKYIVKESNWTSWTNII